jgi:signal transduction protein with GAF and PtsI domain
MPEPTERQKRIKELAGVQRTKRWRENRIAAGKNPSPSYMDLLQEQYEVAWKSIRFSLDQPAPSLVILHS